MTTTSELKNAIDEIRAGLTDLERDHPLAIVAKGEVDEETRLGLKKPAKRVYDALKKARAIMQRKALSESIAFHELPR